MHRLASVGGRRSLTIRVDNAEEEGLLSEGNRRSSADGAPMEMAIRERFAWDLVS